MRTNNVRCNIVAPSFVNMSMCDGGYRLTVSLNISERIFDHLYDCWREGMAVNVFRYRGKHYIHWEKYYGYDTAFNAAYVEAAKALRELQVIIRHSKIELLQKEIDAIEHPVYPHIYGNFVEDIELTF